jgi:hypothetical protein
MPSQKEPFPDGNQMISSNGAGEQAAAGFYLLPRYLFAITWSENIHNGKESFR